MKPRPAILKKASQLNAERLDDIKLIDEVLGKLAAMGNDADSPEDDLKVEDYEKAQKAFTEWQHQLENYTWFFLTDKQRGWLHGVHEKLFEAPQYANEWSAGKIPRGREVATPAVLLNLPKKPPGRSA